MAKWEMKASNRQVGGSHYKDMAIQPGEFIRANGIGWYEGNAIKYICRHAKKGGREDILKAIHYLELTLEEYKEDVPSNPNSVCIKQSGPMQNAVLEEDLLGGSLVYYTNE